MLLFSNDFISSHPSQAVIQGSPRWATTARRDNRRGYGLTRGSPCSAAAKEACTCERLGRSVAWMRGPRTRLSPPLERRRGLARTKVQWNGKHAIPCWPWCRVTVRGCVMFLGYWLNDLGLHGKSLNPCRLCVLTERCVFHLSSHWPEDSAGLTCPHPQSLTSWTQGWPLRDPASLSRSVSHGSGCYRNISLNLCLFLYWYSYGLPARGCQAIIRLSLHGWHGWELSRVRGILFAAALGWKVEAQSKHGPLAQADMKAQRARPLRLPPPPGPSGRQNHHMPFICWNKSECRVKSRSTNKWFIPLYIVCKKDHSAYLTNASSLDVFLTAGLIYGELQRIVKTTITGCVTAAQLSPPCRRGLHREEEKKKKKVVNCKSSCWLRRFCSNLIMWSIILAEAALRRKESHWGTVWRRLHISVCTTMIGCVGRHT